MELIQPWIINVSLYDFMNGKHPFVPGKTIAIQIVDPGTPFPDSNLDFLSVHRFSFLDIELPIDSGIVPMAGDIIFGEDYLITDIDAMLIAECLKGAVENQENVVVHCHLGVCRSGAVAEVGTMLGLNSTGVYRQPNVTVKRKLMKYLNLLPLGAE